MQNKFFGSKFNTILLLVLIVLMIIALIIMSKNKEVYLPPLVEKENINNKIDESFDLEKNPLNFTVGYHICDPGGNDCLDRESYEKVLGNKEDLIAFSILPGQEVFGKDMIQGRIEGGYFFEGNILINILDINKNLIKAGHANSKSDWMTVEPVLFEGDIDFTGIPSGTYYVEIKEDDPSDGEGGPAKKILIPVIIN